MYALACFESSIFSLNFVEVFLLWQEEAIRIQELIIAEVILNGLLVILLKFLKGYINSFLGMGVEEMFP